MSHSRCVPDAREVYRQAWRSGGCSKVAWAERVADALPRAPPVRYINVGANKGYKVPEFLALWSQQPVPGHMKGWQRHLLRYATRRKFRFLQTYSCGNCGDCHGEPPAPHNRTGAAMDLFELASANQKLLRYVLGAEPSVSGRVELHNFAASNQSESIAVYKGLLAGDERGAALTGSKAARYANASASEAVPAIALDDFMEARHLERVYHVAIDTEGWDALVIEGMRRSLAAKRIAIVEFEVCAQPWAQPSLRPMRPDLKLANGHANVFAHARTH